MMGSSGLGWSCDERERETERDGGRPCEETLGDGGGGGVGALRLRATDSPTTRGGGIRTTSRSSARRRLASSVRVGCCRRIGVLWRPRDFCRVGLGFRRGELAGCGGLVVSCRRVVVVVGGGGTCVVSPLSFRACCGGVVVVAVVGGGGTRLRAAWAACASAAAAGESEMCPNLYPSKIRRRSASRSEGESEE